MIKHTMKPAFSMITAIFVIVIMAGLLALVSSLSGKIVKETTAQYRKEQAALLAKSYTEFAILAIQGSNMGVNPCLRTISADINSLDGTSNANGVADGEGYHVQVKMQYIGLPATISCNALTSADTYGFKSLGAFAASTSGDISVMIDVYVMYHDLGMIDAGDTSTWVTHHRRTLQKL